MRCRWCSIIWYDHFQIGNSKEVKSPPFRFGYNWAKLWWAIFSWRSPSWVGCNLGPAKKSVFTEVNELSTAPSSCSRNFWNLYLFVKTGFLAFPRSVPTQEVIFAWPVWERWSQRTNWTEVISTSLIEMTGGIKEPFFSKSSNALKKPVPLLTANTGPVRSFFLWLCCHINVPGPSWKKQVSSTLRGLDFISVSKWLLKVLIYLVSWEARAFARGPMHRGKVCHKLSWAFSF